jgi:hypothetical protein
LSRKCGTKCGCGILISTGKKKLLEKDKKLLESLKKGGRAGAKKIFLTLLKKTAKSSKS